MKSWTFPLRLLALGILLGGVSAVAQPPTPAAGVRPVASPEELACAPALAWGPPPRPITLLGSQEGGAKDMMGPGDALVVGAGRNRGLEVGQRYFVRRVQRPLTGLVVRRPAPLVRQTAGWVRIVAVEARAAVATVEYACDGMLRGDYLEPFEQPIVPEVDPPGGEPDYEGASTVLFGPNGAASAGTGQFVVLSRGSRHDLHRGQRVTLFRRSFGADGPVTELGEGVIVSLTPESSVARLVRMRDAALAGDLAAPHR